MKPANENAEVLTDTARFCPSCAAADIQASALAGSESSCNVCGWKGKVEDLVVYRFTQELGSREAVYRQFFLDLRGLFSQEFLQSFSQLLVKWGFLDAPDGANTAEVCRVLARYVAAASRAVADSLIKTRSELEKEKYAPSTSD